MIIEIKAAANDERERRRDRGGIRRAKSMTTENRRTADSAKAVA